MTPFATPRGSIAEPGPVGRPLLDFAPLPEQGHEMTAGPTPVSPLVFHWFYAKARSSDSSETDWLPFSRADCDALEKVYQSGEAGLGQLVPVLGRRHDVDVALRLMTPVYWECAPVAVRRCSWFSRGAHETKFVPYEEEVAARLEELYEESSRTGRWHRDLQLGEDGYAILHSPGCLVHHPGITAAWEHVNLPDDPSRPRQLRRGWDTVEGAVTPADEPELVNHLVFVVHGIGPWCDLRFRRVTECVDDMRLMAAEMASSHFGGALQSGQLGRVEFLPISWHDALHGAANGLDRALRLITLPSIPLLREFTNDTIVDVLYYTSPMFCQLILRTVGNDINSIYAKFCQRQPEFSGAVSVAGHSLGSLILFDLLSNQTGEQPETAAAAATQQEAPASEDDRFAGVLDSLKLSHHAETLRRAEIADLTALRRMTPQDVDALGLPVGARRALLCWQEEVSGSVPADKMVTVSYNSGTGQPAMEYPQLAFKPDCFFGMGSPIAVFLRIRGVSQLGPDYRLPTCRRVFNIYHPYDPVSYRMEPLIQPEMVRRRPVLVPHHKGRKRMHLEIKDQMVRMGTELKQKLLSSLQMTLGSVYKMGWTAADDDAAEESTAAAGDEGDEDDALSLPVGSLNGGRRVDYVLQEKPFESLNEYVFAFQSHLCYWESEDTLLLLLKEVLRGSGIELESPSQRPPPPEATAATGTAATAAEPVLMSSAADVMPAPTAATAAPVCLVAVAAASDGAAASGDVAGVKRVPGVRV
ncbi:LOW QUALITY PROTEIN: phospholipase DDHD2-like [Pollicipes pollicipes]|uniref:LOW QUALITY PROTEIN: phospholipase DDHD2-like n=1 Tax=Pollicipes pollicipes TaxID=41117 RepID=UPI0018853224|nr:LOW QUALITY PROTEIN: phospholipase DDHD2-like [Pollicipes pollicipes]